MTIHDTDPKPARRPRYRLSAADLQERTGQVARTVIARVAADDGAPAPVRVAYADFARWMRPFVGSN